MARIAVVNSYPDFVELVASILDELDGHDVIGFDSSEATLDDLLDVRPDLLIVDLQTVNGVLSEIEAIPDDPSAAALGLVPTIICSGDIAAMRERADELGSVLELQKPFTVEQLIDMVERALHSAVLESVA